MPRTGSQLHHTRDLSPASTSRSKNLAAQSPSSKINTDTARYRLTHTLLRWCLYDGHGHPFSVVEGWHAPAGRRACEPRPLAQDGQIGTAPPVGAK